MGFILFWCIYLWDIPYFTKTLFRRTIIDLQMTSMDKAAIGYSIGIAAVAVAIAFAGSANPITVVDTPVTPPPTSTPSSTAQSDLFADDAAKVREQASQDTDTMTSDEDETMMTDDTTMTSDEDETMMTDDTTMTSDEDETMMTDDSTMTSDEDTADATPAEDDSTPTIWKITTPEGTSIPGCEIDDTCFSLSSLTISVGDSVHWINHDTVAHTVTSGSVQSGPDNIFDSGLSMPDDVFEHTFEESGSYPYFCLVHPWMMGVVEVE